MTDFRNTPISVRETLVAHNVHRRATTLLADAAARPDIPAAAVADLRDFLVPNLHHHHESEDGELWPMITAAAPDITSALTDLSGEHDQLDAALDALGAVKITEGDDRTGLVEAAVALRDLVHRHMEHEEPLLFPALRDHVSDEAWDTFAQHVKATSPTVGIHFLIGFIDRERSADDVELMLGDLPAPVLEALRAQAGTALAVLEKAS